MQRAGSRRTTTRSRANDENANPVRSTIAGASRVAAKATVIGAKATAAKRERSVLGAVTNTRDDIVEDTDKAGKVRGETRRPLASRANAQTRPIAPVPQRTRTAPSTIQPISVPVAPAVPAIPTIVADDDDYVVDMDVDRAGLVDLDEDTETLNEYSDDDEDNWMRLHPDDELASHHELLAVRQTFQDDIDLLDTTMVAEYADEIFNHMEELEIQTMANPNYMDHQTEVQWQMRTTLVDWLLQLHMRYHLLPETLWIGINLVDRFLSTRVVSLNKLQLVGVTAMFIAAKYEEIIAPSVDEFVFMTENGYTKDEILKGERIILQTLDFNVSSYCSPYSWARRISKADDYDIQTRTLCKFLMEVTLLDHRFLRCKPSMIAAIGMYVAKKMLGGDWNDAFVFYSGFTERQLIPAAVLLCDRLAEDGFEKVYCYKKYQNKKFLRASTFAVDWAYTHAAATWPRE